jgi:alkylation response protein AidB-like acyl-CoA dehydrogenase
MGFALTPRSEPGRKFVELAEMHAVEMAPHAAPHDHDGTFPVEAIESMKASGFLTAGVGPEHGGLGVASVYDLMVGISRVARADSSVAIAINMHFAIQIIASRLLRSARESGDAEAAAGLEQMLGLLGSGMIGMANATEAGTDIRHPMTEATKVDGGWRLDGRKIFGTLSPVADIMIVPCRSRRDDGGYDQHTAIVFRGTPGQTILDDWDALGMRASGSNSIVYDNCVVPESLVFSEGTWGEIGQSVLIIGTAGNLGLLGAFLGVAEAARDHVADQLRTRTKQPSGRTLAERMNIQHAMAELETDLATCRAHLAWIGEHVDRLVVERPVSSVTLDELHELMATFQSSKLVVNRAAIDVVDKALQLSGGSGYFSASPLARLYRDVRAGPFMQPFSPNEAYEYIGKISLGQPPDLEG